MPKPKQLDAEEEIRRKKLLADLDDEDDEDEDDDDDADDEDLDDEEEDDDLDDDEEVRPKASDCRRPRAKPRAGKPPAQAAVGEQSRNTSPAAPRPTRAAVPDDDPQLRSLLHRAVTDEAAGLEFAGWLEAEGDPRADAVRDLFTPVPAIPPRPDGKVGHPMVAGRGWVVVLHKTGVAAWVYFNTPMSELVLAAGGREFTRVEIRIAATRQTPEVLTQAFRACRERFLLALFGMNPAMMAAERVIRDTEAAVDEVLGVLRRVRLNAVPWLCALRRSQPAWFSKVMSQAMRDKQLRAVCDAVLDAVDGGWREKLLAGVGDQK